MKKRLIFILLISLTFYMFTRISADSLTIKIDDTVVIDSNINITLFLDNIKYDNFTFKLYSSESLENVNTENIDLTNYNNEEISFDYCINCSTLKTIVLNYKLPAQASIGDNITFYAQIINKDNLEEVTDYRKVVTIIDKEIVQEESKDNNKPKTNYSGNFTSRVSTNKSVSTSSISTKYKGSSNNYLSNLSVKGYKLNKEFIKERLTYFVTVPNNVTSLNIQTTKDDSKSSVNISENSNFEVGVNKVLITVTAQDGRTKNYRIYVTRLESDTSEK